MSDFSIRKFSRKVDSDGVKPAIIDAIELIARKYASKPAFNILNSVGVLPTVGRDDLIDRASNVSQSFNSAEGGETRFAASLEGGYLLPTTGLSFTEDWEIISESVSNPDLSNLFVREAIVRHDRLSDINISTKLVGLSHLSSKHIKDAGTIAPLSPRYYNYYHWMIQTLPRLRYLKDYERQTDEEVTIILPPENPPWMEETLEMIGWPERKIERGTHPVYHASKLVIPSYPPVHEQEIRWLREQLLPHADDLDQDSGTNIFISRSNAIERRIVNENSVVECLEEEGFSKQNLEYNSVSRNIALFNNADIIAGTHGAGLTDLIFCDDCKVIELFGSKVKWHYRRLSEELDIGYECIQCQPESTDLVVDVDELKTTVQSCKSEANE